MKTFSPSQSDNPQFTRLLGAVLLLALPLTIPALATQKTSTATSGKSAKQVEKRAQRRPKPVKPRFHIPPIDLWEGSFTLYSAGTTSDDGQLPVTHPMHPKFYKRTYADKPFQIHRVRIFDGGGRLLFPQAVSGEDPYDKPCMNCVVEVFFLETGLTPQVIFVSEDTGSGYVLFLYSDKKLSKKLETSPINPEHVVKHTHPGYGSPFMFKRVRVMQGDVVRFDSNNLPAGTYEPGEPVGYRIMFFNH